MSRVMYQPPKKISGVPVRKRMKGTVNWSETLHDDHRTGEGREGVKENHFRTINVLFILDIQL